MLAPEDVCRQLVTRVAALERELARLDSVEEHAYAMQVPRLFMLEGEPVRGKLVAELDSVRSVVADPESGVLA